MINSLPSISIIIPTFNRAHFIGETLDSIIAQTYTNWECIVVDDGSTDNTDEIVEAYVKEDARFQYHKRPDIHKPGGNGARNYGFEISKGKYINWFDSDDLMDSKKLEIQYNILKSNSDIDFVISQTAFFNNSINKIIGYWNHCIISDDNLNDFIQKKIGWSTSAPLWRRESLIQNSLKFDERLKNGQDFKFHVEALLCELTLIAVNETLTFNRVHSNQIKSNRNKSASKALIFKFICDNKYKINKSSLSYIEIELINLVPKLYLEKRIKLALKLSLYVIKKTMSLKVFLYVIYYTMSGLAYYVTNKGYKILKVKYR